MTSVWSNLQIQAEADQVIERLSKRNSNYNCTMV